MPYTYLRGRALGPVEDHADARVRRPLEDAGDRLGHEGHAVAVLQPRGRQHALQVIAC